jgi:hypothetical protein
MDDVGETEDELQISAKFPEARQRHAAAVGAAVVVHFAYFRQVCVLPSGLSVCWCQRRPARRSACALHTSIRSVCWCR